MAGRLRTAAAAAVTIGLPVSACGTTVPGTPVAAASGLLDPGNFPTSPRKVVAITAADAWQQEGFIMADSVVDPDLTAFVSISLSIVRLFLEHLC